MRQKGLEPLTYWFVAENIIFCALSPLQTNPDFTRFIELYLLLSQLNSGVYLRE
ncbi:hypothetical protein CLOSTMETH_02030 [[Clostridium] methylpentosum DSM 5476]|uniref:Uncharacterized protein n=1 Tax=[Clostridium] methylpentosum DSM 5476 TaxID=537013 RepID=C0EDV1_9FIRM|nr:hypothetical protein CLOSTMETH_02030 [[Clostridium] methylpentosum DSM 5476]